MKEVGKQSDIEEIIRRLRGGKGFSEETPLTRTEYVSLQPEPSQNKRGSSKEVAVEPSVSKTFPDKSIEIAALEKELSAYRQKEASWQTEKELLRKEQRNLLQGEKDSFSTHFKLLEEKLLSLAGEKESVTNEIAHLKSVLSETEKALSEKTARLQEVEDKLSQELLYRKEQEELSSQLTKEKEKLTHKEESLQTQVSLLTNALSEEKNHKEIIALSVKANQEHIAELRAELANLHGILQEKEGRFLALQLDKEKTEARTREVEEHLILKLASITELEEELTATGARVEELEAKNISQEAIIASLTETNATHEATITMLNQDLNDYKGRITRANDTITELRRRIESLERIKTMMEDATAHVHALTDLFGPTPQSLPSLRNLVESFVVKKSIRRPSQGAEETVEQPNLF